MAFSGFDARLNLSGYTALPNALFEELSNIESLAELKIILATFRKTYGWIERIDENGQPVYKQEDSISYSQFGELTGLSSPSISAGLDKAISDGYMRRVSEGTYQGKAAVYQIRLKGTEGGSGPGGNGEGPEPGEGHQQWDQNKAKEVDKKITEPLDKRPNGFSTKAAEQKASKADMMADMFGAPAEEEGKKGKVNYKTKDRVKWNCNDILTYYRDRYQDFFKLPFGVISGRERRNCNLLIAQYGVEQVVKVIDYMFADYAKINYLPADTTPSFGIFFGFFKSLHGDVYGKGAAVQNKAQKEFDEGKHSGRNGAVTW